MSLRNIWVLKRAFSQGKERDKDTRDPALEVRALVNFRVDYFRTSLAGQQPLNTNSADGVSKVQAFAGRPPGNMLKSYCPDNSV